MNKQPQVTEKTRKKLIASFWKMYKTNDISKITIGNICKRADYERTSFYRYFDDINDILEQTEKEIVESIRSDIQKNYKDEDTGIFYEGFKKFNSKYGEYIVVFHEKGNRNFYNKFKALVKEDVFKYLKFNVKDEKEKDFLFEFMFSSLISSYAYWYRHQKSMTLESFVKYANNLLLNGTKDIIIYK